MATHSCPSCQGAVDVPETPGGGRFACPHCAEVIDTRPNRTSVSADMETPPDGVRAIDPERHQARIRVAMSLFRGRGRGLTTGRTDGGAALALLGITVGVPALFVSPWANPLVLGLSGMALCLVGLATSRDKLIGVVGILLCAACAGGGIVLEPHVWDIAAKLGLVEPAKPAEVDYGLDNLRSDPPADPKADPTGGD